VTSISSDKKYQPCLLNNIMTEVLSHYILCMATAVASESHNPRKCGRKSGQFGTLTPESILGLKIGQVDREPRKGVDHLTSIVTSNLIPRRVLAIANEMAPRQHFLVESSALAKFQSSTRGTIVHSLLRSENKSSDNGRSYDPPRNPTTMKPS